VQIIVNYHYAITRKTIGEDRMKDVRIIKRYQNRKLYDTFQSCYVTLEEIAQIVREGNEIQVIDNKTKNDITYMTQIQLLFDQERKSLKPGDTELLKRVIRSEEGTLTGYIKGLESQLNLNFGNENETATEETETISANFINNSFSSNANIETPNTLN
jgi:polyhydroxyalkanoate synthesis repressor PhaR